MKWLVLLCILVGSALSANAQEPEAVSAYIFGKDDCAACRAEIKYLFDEDVSYQYLNIETDAEAKRLYEALLDKHDLGEVLPLAVVGEQVIAGYSNPQTSGRTLQTALYNAKTSDIKTVEDHLSRAPKYRAADVEACRGLACDTTATQPVYDVPFLGTVDITNVSSFFLAIVLGVTASVSVFALGAALIMIGSLLFFDTRQNVLLVASGFLVLEAIGLYYFLNAGYHSIHMFVLPEAFARILETHYGVILRQVHIFAYSLCALITPAVLASAVWFYLPALQKLEDQKAGVLGMAGACLIFVGGVLMVQRIYFA